MKDATTCRVHYADGTPCGRSAPLRSRLCKVCQEWSRRHGGADPQGRELSAKRPGSGRKTCSVVEDGRRCLEHVEGHKLCARHYKRWKKNGNPLAARPKRTDGSLLAEVEAAAAVTGDACVLLTSNSGDRAHVTLNGVHMHASRAVWITANGDPGDQHVLHTCNGGSGAHGCISIRHLRLGANADNAQDKVDAGRQIWGEKHHKHILTEGEVREVHRRYKPRDPINGGRALAAEFGVSPSTISCVVRGKTWTQTSAGPG